MYLHPSIIGNIRMFSQQFFILISIIIWKYIWIFKTCYKNNFYYWNYLQNVLYRNPCMVQFSLSKLFSLQDHLNAWKNPHEECLDKRQFCSLSSASMFRFHRRASLFFLLTVMHPMWPPSNDKDKVQKTECYKLNNIWG